MKRDKVVVIEWEDSYHDSDWMGRGRARYDSRVSKCKTVGYLLKSNLREVTVFQSKSDTGNITDTMSIPKKCIKSLRYLGEE